MEKLGAKIELRGGYVKATCNQLIGNKIVLPFPSVGATENLIMAAVFARGVSIIENIAREPEIDDLINFLLAAGAKIEKKDSNSVIIEGVEPDSFKSIEYSPIGDRIEAATYLIAALITGSSVRINGINPATLESVIELLHDMGASIECGDNYLQVNQSTLKACKIDTAPFPGFPTDVQAQLMALCTKINGTSLITEHIFENRFMHVSELIRMGAEITLKGNMAVVEGGGDLLGAPVMCTDLRASAALVLAALAASGRSEVARVYHIDRGYEEIDKKLKQLGANIQRVNDKE